MFFVSNNLDDWQRFADWLNAELKARNFSGRGLAAKAGISHVVVARMRNAQGSFDVESLNAVADALEVPRERVQQLIGLLDDDGELLPEAKSWSARLRSLSSETREAAIQAMTQTLVVYEGVEAARRR